MITNLVTAVHGQVCLSATIGILTTSLRLAVDLIFRHFAIYLFIVY